MGYSSCDGRDKSGRQAGPASPRPLPVFWRHIQVNRLHLQAMPRPLGQICGLGPGSLTAKPFQWMSVLEFRGSFQGLMIILHNAKQSSVNGESLYKVGWGPKSQLRPCQRRGKARALSSGLGPVRVTQASITLAM